MKLIKDLFAFFTQTDKVKLDQKHLIALIIILRYSYRFNKLYFCNLFIRPEKIKNIPYNKLNSICKKLKRELRVAGIINNTTINEGIII